MVSSTSVRSWSGNGGGSASARTSTVQSPISIGPGGESASSSPCPRGEARTVPVMATTYSRAQVELFVDHALDDAGAVPHVDEGQVFAVDPAGVHPAAHGDVRGRCRAAHRARRSSRSASPSGVILFACSFGSARAGAGDVRRRSLPRRRRAASRTVMLACFQLVLTRPERPSARRIGRRPSSGPSWTGCRTHGRSAPCRPAGARRCQLQGLAVPPATSTTKTVDGARGTGRRRISASQANRIRSTPRANPMPGVGGPPSASTSPS